MTEPTDCSPRGLTTDVGLKLGLSLWFHQRQHGRDQAEQTIGRYGGGGAPPTARHVNAWITRSLGSTGPADACQRISRARRLCL